MIGFDALLRGEFHGSLLNNIMYKDKNIIFEIEYYDKEDNIKNIRVVIKNVDTVKKNDNTISKIIMEGEYGSIIWLSIKDNTINIGLDWRNCFSEDTGTCIYDFSGLNIKLEAED